MTSAKEKELLRQQELDRAAQALLAKNVQKSVFGGGSGLSSMISEIPGSKGDIAPGLTDAQFLKAYVTDEKPKQWIYSRASGGLAAIDQTNDWKTARAQDTANMAAVNSATVWKNVDYRPVKREKVELGQQNVTDTDNTKAESSSKEVADSATFKTMLDDAYKGVGAPALDKVGIRWDNSKKYFVLPVLKDTKGRYVTISNSMIKAIQGAKYGNLQLPFRVLRTLKIAASANAFLKKMRGAGKISEPTSLKTITSFAYRRLANLSPADRATKVGSYTALATFLNSELTNYKDAVEQKAIDLAVKLEKAAPAMAKRRYDKLKGMFVIA